MDKQNQTGLDSLNNANGSGLTEVPWSAAPSGGLQEVPLYQPTKPVSVQQPAAQPGAPAKPAPGQIPNDRLDAIAQREGLTPAQARIWKEGILAQESDKGANSKTSVDGARGAGQVIPDTFSRFAKPGETIDNVDHNLAVSARIVKALGSKFGDDPGKIAVGYFSGEGNVNPGKGLPYKADRKDGNGKTVSGYAQDVAMRLTGIKPAEGGETKEASAATPNVPKWVEIVAKPEYAKLSPQEQKEAKEAYFDYYIVPIAGNDVAELREQFLSAPNPAPNVAPNNSAQTSSAPAGQAKPDTVKNPFAPPSPTGASTAPSAEVNTFAAAYDMVEGKPAPAVQNKGGSVMSGNERVAPKALPPVDPKVRAAIESKWDAADAKTRKQMEAAPGWQGDIVRARAAGFKQQDKTGRDPLQNAQLRGQLESAYKAAPPEEKRRLEALDGWQGDVFRQMRDGVFALTKNVPPDAAQRNQTVDSIDPRYEARYEQQILKGEKPGFADAAARAGAQRGATPGQERGALEGVAEASDFDFETQKLFDPNERPNGLNNPLVRGVIKGGSDLYKFGAGISEFVYDMAGADDMAKGMRDQANWLRAKDAAMGEGGALRHVEGAIRSIAAQIPLIASGSQALALGGMGLTVFGQEYSDGRAKGQSAGEATMRAGLYAIAEIVGERLSIGANMKAARALFDKVPVDQVPKLIGEILAKEVPGEMLTTTLQFGADKMPGGVGLNPNATLGDFIQQQADTFVQTVIQSGLMGGAPMVRSHLTNKGTPTERRVAELRAMAAQDQALAKWEQFRQSIRPSEPTVGTTSAPVTSSRNEPTMAGGTPPVTSVSPDGRIEPTLEGQPTTAAANPDPQANAINPPTTTEQPVVPEDPGVDDLAEVRLEQLRGKRDGTTKMVMTEDGPKEVEVDPVALTPAEKNELDILESGNRSAIQAFYFGQEKRNEGVQTQTGVDGTAPATGGANGQPGGAASVEEPAAQAAGTEGSAEGGERQQGLPAEGAVTDDEEARLEREAIQSEQDTPVQEPDDSDIPFDTKPRDGTQTPQAEQAEAQGSQEPADEVAPPKTEKEAQIKREYEQSVEKWNALSGEYKAASEERRAQLRPIMDALNKEQTRLKAELSRLGMQRMQQEGREKSSKKFGWMPIGTKVGMIGHESNDNLYWEKTGDDEWTRRGMGSGRVTKTNSEMEGGRIISAKQAAPKTEKEAKEQKQTATEQEFIDELAKARAELPDGFEIQSEGNSISLIENGRKAVNGLNRNAGGVQEALRQAKLRSEERSKAKTANQESGAPAPKTEAEARKEKAKQDLDAALGDLGELLGKNTRMNIAPEEEQKLLPILTRVMDAAFRMGYYKFKDAARFVLNTIRDRLGNEAADQITLDHLQGAYIGMAGKYQTEGTASSKKEVIAVESLDELTGDEGEKVEPTLDSPTDLFTPEGKMKVAQTLADEFIGGASFKTIIEARKRISELIGKPIEAATELAKQADETIEVAVVLAAREIVQAGRKQGRSAQVIYDRLVDLYNRQPNLAVRSSTSVREQAYSTPVPLAYLASELAGITYDSKVLEPTAGNGMLLIGAATENSTANELNGKRADMLDAMGIESERKNAATESLAPAKSQDAVIANPPFGATKDADGNTIIYEVKPDYGTREVDHAIAFNALETMKDDGRAVLIVGGVQAEGDEARREDYRGKSKRSFYFNLYKDYNVVDHFTVDGSLYSKQGASYPVDVIVIEGRGKSSRDLPAADLPQIIGSYEELKGKLNGTRRVESKGVSGTDRTAGGEGAAGQGDGAPVDRGAGRPGDGDGNRGGTGSDTASVQGSEPAGDGQPAGGGAVSGDGQSESSYQPRLRNRGGSAVSGDGQERAGSAGSDRGNRSGVVDGSSQVAGERVESGLTDRRGEEQETENQVSYEPRSNAASVGTLVPRAMRDSIQASLEKIEAQFGNIDEYVADRLNYDPETLRANFSAEQVDALALAIKNAEEGRGFIIGDQTGIGKGRVVAAMIRYAIINDKTPIFVTEKPNLYSDMIRDLDDIGMTEELGLDTAKPKIFMTNADESVPYTLIRESNGEITETNLTLRPPKTGKALGDMMRKMMDGESLGDYKVIFTTYSQLQTVKGKVTDRMKFVQQFGAGNYMIFDESHNAGGGGPQRTKARSSEQREAEGSADQTGRAAFVRGLVNAAFGTFFSSATYAKRPDVMDLYSSTNMKLAVDKISQLGEAIKNGGVPMQQVVATMLTQDGQYIRRERTFAGVSYDTQETKVDKQTAENMAAAMRAILDFSRAKESVIKTIQKKMDKEGSLVKQMGGEKSTIQGANFGSIMHNLIDQMLLSLKVQESVNHAIERLKAGEKVVMTVSNTMGSFLKDYAEEMGLNMGDPVALSFKDLYDRYLEKQRMVTIKDGAGRKTQRRLTDAELGPSLVKKFEAVRKQIADAGFGSAPISPIDYLHNELRKAGYKTDEITGRTVTLNYQSGTPKLTSRSANIRQRVKAVRGFNNGEVDVIILNQAGSTGLSLHASSKFKDQRKRHMIIVQAEKNIDTHMQMLGRVHRTGQVMPPAYSQMMADIPAEMRPAAVLMKKMASLNANTTASRKSAVSAEGVVDFMNDYGGQVAQEFLRDNPDVLEAVGGNKVIPLNENSEEATEDDIRKFTGYIPILPIKQQEQIYKDLVERYNELIERENTLGTNKLEAKAVDLDAQVLSSVQITENKGDPSIFASPANMEQVDVKRNVKPYTSAEVAEMVSERLGDKTGGAIANEMTRDVAERVAAFEKERVAEMLAKETDPVKIEGQRSQISMMLNHVRTILQNYRIGDSIAIKDKNGFIIYGVITDIQNKGRTQNPAAGSAWKMQIALANGDAKSLTINFGQIGNRYELSREARVNWYDAETQSAKMMSIMEIFDKGSTVRREKRWMVTGNILAGFAKYPGQIIQYTKADGTQGQGVLMNRQFDFNKEQKTAPVTLKTGAQVMQFMQAVGDGAMVGTPDGVLRIRLAAGKYVFAVPSSKREGGTYYLDKGITGALGEDFYKRGQQMTASTYSSEDAQAAIDYIINGREDTIIAMSDVEKAREMFGVKPKGGVELNDISADDIQSDLATDSVFSALAEPERVDALRRLKALERKAAAGKITDAEHRLGVAQVVADMQRKADARNEPTDLVRGSDWVRERLLRARRTGELPSEVADFALWLLDKNPALANDLAISLKTGKSGSPSGSYQSLNRLVTLFKNKVNTGTAVHEILHHAERMMDGAMQKGIIREWQRAWDAAYRKATPEQKDALLKLLKGGIGDQASFKEAVQAFKDGILNYDEHYQLTNPSEYWAVNATRILSQRYGATTWQERARQFLREMVNYFKAAFGFRSDVPVMRALRQVINGTGSMVSSKMLVEQMISKKVEANPDIVPPTEFMDIRDRVQSMLYKEPSLKTFGRYDRTISTQLNKALKDADYAKVFGYVNAIQNEVSLTSLRPAEMAPGWLPRITDVKAAAKTVVMGRRAASAQAKAAKAIFAGTLAGDTVMEGKVWSPDELRNNFGLDDTGVALYVQAREAIDASIDEVAAAEAYAMAQGFIPKAMRRAIINNPQAAESLIAQSLQQQIKKLQKAVKAARDAGNDDQAASLEETINGYFATSKQVEKIFTTSRNLKAAGYAPLMRFGKYTVTVQAIDPATGNLIRNEEGSPLTMFFGKFETEGEAQHVRQSMEIQYAGRDDVKISAGVASEQAYELYSGISPESLALFAEALGADQVMKKYIQEAMSERSALKRRLERKGVEGYVQDMPRVLANFITSNARHASKQYYMRDLNNAIKYIPKEKGDVKDESIKLREFVLNAKDPGTVVSAITFAWFLGGSVSSALVNMTQPIMMTGPYLSQFGVTTATTAMAKALPIALGKKQITDPALRDALKRASQEGVVDAQEIFHLYSQGAQSTATWLASALSKVPGAGAKIKAGSESVRARASAFGVLWGSMFAAAEGFNRRLTFVAAWEVAKARNERNPYAFAVRAVNETQGIFNKANRPNLARGRVGRMVFTFKQYSIMYVELVKRMSTKGGPEGKRAALIMLAVLLLASGEEGLLFSQDLADVIDTIGQWMGYDTNTLRKKRELAHDILGKQLGDFALYGLSSFLPVDFQGRLGLGNLIPMSGALKKSNTALETAKSLSEFFGPTASIGQQIGDAMDAMSDENYAQAGRNMAPTAIKNLVLGLDMLDKGYAVDAAGNRKVDTTPADAIIKMVGFNPTVVAEKNRSQMPVRQDINLQKEVESSIVKQWARGQAEGDEKLKAKAEARLEEWNKKNPKTPIKLTFKQKKEALKKMGQDSDQRLIKQAPKEMRARVREDLADD